MVGKISDTNQKHILGRRKMLEAATLAVSGVIGVGAGVLTEKIGEQSAQQERELVNERFDRVFGSINNIVQLSGGVVKGLETLMASHPELKEELSSIKNKGLDIQRSAKEGLEIITQNAPVEKPGQGAVKNATPSKPSIRR